MDELKKQIVTADSLQKARNYIKKPDWARAFAHFLVVFELSPNEKHNYELEFENVFFNLRSWLDSTNQLENIFNCYIQAIRHFPTNIRMLNDFGSHWLRINQPELALKYLEAAHEADENFLLAEKNLQSAKLSILPRWHFRMLNDCKRNRAYRDAIIKSITTQHNKVLDIGAGCGLLSFYASQCKDVQKIISIESSSTLSMIATKCLSNTNLITVINNNSNSLDSGNVGLSNILVTEIFDTGLFGEHVLETLIHAWDNLLEPSSKIVPCSADVYITGISSDSSLNKHRIINDRLVLFNLENLCATQRRNEPYGAENLIENNIRYITTTKKVLHVDFSNINQLKQLYTLDNSIPQLTLEYLEDGIIDALVVWFDLHLDEAITITTNPLKDSVNCWEQAVIYLDHPLTMKKDQRIKLQVSCNNNMLNVKILDTPINCQNCFKVSSDIITFINDMYIVKTAEILMLPNRFNNKHCVILDLSPASLFALFRAKRNFPGHYICVCTHENDISFLNVLWRKNIDVSVADITYEIVLQDNIFDKISEDSIDVIFVNPISENGILSEEVFNNLPALNSALKKDGLILPQNVYLQMEVIDSTYLDFCSRVNEENLLGFEVANEINNYSILEQWQVRQECYPRRILSTANIDFNILNNERFSVDLNVVSREDGVANGVLYGYRLEYNDTFLNTYHSSHYNNACFMFKQSQVVCGGDTLVINVIKDDGLLKVVCKGKM